MSVNVSKRGRHWSSSASLGVLFNVLKRGGTRSIRKFLEVFLKVSNSMAILQSGKLVEEFESSVHGLYIPEVGRILGANELLK